ncbi:polycomb group RING finger protein 3-like [Dysidea avara]|uniref:polycomb group RING finger protein 3-like n=1 Tax=Dysidea avara TaxID=196820 RepID=UPI0033254DE0
MQTVVKISEVNQYITCRLCAGYLVDATTITECLHTFCKGCIVKYLQSNAQCPICGTMVNETHPITSLRADRTMQDIVYKMVPELEISEQERKRKFLEERGEKGPAAVIPEKPVKVERAQEHFHRDDEKIQLQVEPHGSLDEGKELLQPLMRKYMRCSAKVTIYHLKKFLARKLEVPPTHELELLCGTSILHKDNNLRFVWLQHWLKKESPLLLHYTLRRRIG